jgi:hypothetical protein
VNRPPKPENRSLLVWERGRDPRLTEPADDPASRAANCSTGAAHLREPHEPWWEVTYTLRQPLCTFAVQGRQFYAGCTVLSRITSSTTAMAASASGTYSCQFSSRRRSIPASVHPSSRHASALEVSQIARATRPTRALILSNRVDQKHHTDSRRFGTSPVAMVAALHASLIAREWPRMSVGRTLGGYRSRDTGRQQQCQAADQDFDHGSSRLQNRAVLFRPVRVGCEMLHTSGGLAIRSRRGEGEGSSSPSSHNRPEPRLSGERLQH